MQIQQIVSPGRIVLSLPAANKDQLLEKLSTLLGEGAPEVDTQVALRSLIKCEQLGSTGIGDGVALPHGRLKDLKQAVGAFVTLEQGIDYGALDRKPVRMAFALLLPEGPNQEYLLLLRDLAVLFSNKLVRENLLHAGSVEELYSALTRTKTAA